MIPGCEEFHVNVTGNPLDVPLRVVDILTEQKGPKGGVKGAAGLCH